MKNNARPTPKWIANLRLFMQARDLNPRSLSIKAGLNATAVRDMLEGRTQSPRYDTVEALARSLDVTPAQLMAGDAADIPPQTASAPHDDDLDLLTEIITHLQELADEKQHDLPPRDFAAMVTAIFKQVQGGKDKQQKIRDIKPRAHDLLTYETIRRRAKT